MKQSDRDAAAGGRKHRGKARFWHKNPDALGRPPQRVRREAGASHQLQSVRLVFGGKRAPRVRETPAQLTAALESRLRELGFHLELARILSFTVRPVGVHEDVAGRAGLRLLLRQIRLRN